MIKFLGYILCVSTISVSKGIVYIRRNCVQVFQVGHGVMVRN